MANNSGYNINMQQKRKDFLWCCGTEQWLRKYIPIHNNICLLSYVYFSAKQSRDTRHTFDTVTCLLLKCIDRTTL